MEVEEKYKTLIDYAEEIMAKVEDPKHSLEHMKSVVEYTKMILKNHPEADKDVCIIAAYFHDIGRLIKDDGHEKISADMLKEKMKVENYSEELIERCYKAIINHSWKDKPESLEGMIVRDADKIDFVGISRWDMCLKNNIDMTDITELLPNLRNDILMLDSSRKIYDIEHAKLTKYLYDRWLYGR